MTLRFFTIALTLLFFSCYLTAQTDDPFSFGFAFTPKTSFAKFNVDNLNESRNRIGLNAQILVKYQRHKKFAFVTGIKYSLDHFELKEYYVFFGSDFDPINSMIDFEKSWAIRQLNYHYLGVPVEGRYYLKTDNSRIYTKLGFEYFFNIAAKQNAAIFECGVNELPISGDFIDKPKEYGTKASFGFGIELAVSEKTTLFLEPEVAYSTTIVNQSLTILNDASNPYRLFDIGLRVGMMF